MRDYDSVADRVEQLGPNRRHNYEPKIAEWVLREADRLIHDDRNQQYGPAVQDFEVIAGYWNNYLDSIGHRPINAKDVALLMALLKIRRESTHPKIDNIVDACGYLALAQKCEDEENMEAHREAIEEWKEEEYDGEETVSPTEGG